MYPQGTMNPSFQAQAPGQYPIHTQQPVAVTVTAPTALAQPQPVFAPPPVPQVPSTSQQTTTQTTPYPVQPQTQVAYELPPPYDPYGAKE